MPDIKQTPDKTDAQTDTKKVPTRSNSPPASSPRQSAFGHALDGSQQLDILEEQVYANTDGPAKDQPIVPPKHSAK